MSDIYIVVRYDIEIVDGPGDENTRDEGLIFAAFSLAHAACGDHVLEVRVGERMLLEWCMACTVMEVFGSPER